MIYFDSASAMPPLLPVGAFLRNYTVETGNPSSAHFFGRNLTQKLDKSRRIIAKTLNAKPEEVIFTSGATESLLHAVYSYGKGKKRILVSPFCHSAIWNSLKSLQKFQNVEVVQIPLQKNGQWDLDSLKNENFDMVIADWVGSELGIVQDVAKLYKIAKSKGEIPVIVDTTAGLVAYDFSFSEFPADVSCVSSEKLGGIAGTGLLLVKKSKNSIAFNPFVPASQEWGARGGTQNLLGIEILAEILPEWTENREKYVEKWKELKKNFIKEVESLEGALKLTIEDYLLTSPHIIHVTLQNMSGELAVAKLDQLGFAVSAGSACQSGASDPSRAMMALGFDKNEAKRGLRVSFGWNTTKNDVEKLVEALKKI